jgi:hypothetical protein
VAKVQPKTQTPQQQKHQIVVSGRGTSWSTALLELLGAPLTAANYQFLNAWATREHGHSYPASLFANNPFFTSAGGGGSAKDFPVGEFPLIPGSAFSSGVNTAKIPEYPSLTIGVEATAETLQQSGSLLARSGRRSARALPR